MPVGEWNQTFLRSGGSVAEYGLGRDHLIETGIIEMHECGSMFRWKMTPVAEKLSGTELIP